jgi:hypothetical protein
MSESRFNPKDFAGGRCGCKPPFAPGQFEVVDWTMDDFYTVSMTEWI